MSGREVLKKIPKKLTPEELTPEGLIRYLYRVYTESLTWQNNLNKLSEALEVIIGDGVPFDVVKESEYLPFDEALIDRAKRLSIEIVDFLEMFTDLSDSNILFTSLPNLSKQLESEESRDELKTFISFLDISEHRTYQKDIKKMADRTQQIIAEHGRIVLSLQAIGFNIMDLVDALEATAKQD